ncbi:MAG: hypothetical protein IPN88_06285 [Bacteroidetes bacterium]|nr:hypothetical protein [Bacteroidota bacterium]
MKKYLPHVVALLAFVVITFLYFSPMLGGKELKQSDIANWEGMSKEITDFQAKTGEFTYWTNSMFGGMPGYQISAVYPYTLFKYVDNILTLGLPTPANYLFLFMAGFYFLLITLKVDRRVAIMGAVGFAFSSYFILFIGTGHNSKAHAIGYMAPSNSRNHYDLPRACITRGINNRNCTCFATLRKSLTDHLLSHDDCCSFGRNVFLRSYR